MFPHLLAYSPVSTSSFGFAKWFQSSILLSTASVLLTILICLPYLAGLAISVLFKYPVHGHEIFVVIGYENASLEFLRNGGVQLNFYRQAFE